MKKFIGKALGDLGMAVACGGMAAAAFGCVALVIVSMGYLIFEEGYIPLDFDKPVYCVSAGVCAAVLGFAVAYVASKMGWEPSD